jgi:hypothetical protein
MKSNIQSHVRCCFLLTLLLGYETLKYRRKILLSPPLLFAPLFDDSYTKNNARERESTKTEERVKQYR